jgi:hypothetical protein
LATTCSLSLLVLLRELLLCDFTFLDVPYS